MVPPLPKPITLLELLDADGCRYVSQVIFVAGEEDFIVPGALRAVPLPRVFTYPVEAHDPHPLHPLGVLGRRHATFTSCDCLGHVEREAGDIADRPYHLSPMAG